MGLLFLYPTELNPEDDRLVQSSTSITLKTYGLPFLFWAYYGAIAMVILVMYLASKDLFQKMYAYNDPVLFGLAFVVQCSLVATPLVLLAFFFYESHLTWMKDSKTMILTKKIFFIPFYQKKMEDISDIWIDSFLDSPNVAKMRHRQDLKHFENKGYFELKAKNQKGDQMILDRHSRKADLVKMKTLFSVD